MKNKKHKYHHTKKCNEKSACTTTEEMLNQDEKENARILIIKLKVFNLSR